MSELHPSGVPFFLVPELPTGPDFVLDGEEGRHAAVVRRMRAGEQLVVADGAGGWALSTVTAVGKAQLSLRVEDRGRQPAPRPRVTLVQALTKSDRGELAVDLATEAGVDEIVPWAAARCVARWSPDRAERGIARWQAAAREAAKQARRSRVPPVAPLADTRAVAGRIAAAAAALVLHEVESVSLKSISLPEDGDLVVVVGPEGGLTAGEVELFTAAGARAVRLGPQVLRSAVAGAVALGALGVLTDRWELG